jgi:ferric-dicitrate binding protein FerR (iron transport regulator)
MKDSNHIYQYSDYTSLSNEPLSDKEELLLTQIFEQSAQYPYPSTKVDLEWQKLESKLGIPKAIPITKPKPNFYMFKWLSAAIVLLIVSIGLLQYNNSQDSFIETFQTQANPNSYTLPDGTEIKLSTYSQVNVNFKGKSRKVELLNGEVYFNVKHNKTPFVVHTQSGDITVLGTVFNVKNRPNIPFQVVLLQGLINFETPSNVFELQQGQMIQNTSTGFKLLEATPVLWVDGKLEFKNKPLHEIISELNAYYKVKFKVPESLLNESITLTIDQLDVLKTVDLLSKVLNVKVEVE